MSFGLCCFVASFVMTLSWLLSCRVRYYLKFVLYMCYTLFTSAIFVPLMIPRGRDSRNGLLPAWAVRVCSRWLLGLTYEVRGLENVVPADQGCVLLLNHQSSLDVIAMTYLWPHIPNGCTIAKREVFWVYPFPWFWNTVFINRLNPQQAKNDINKVGDLINKDKNRICMFPEGTRHEGDKLLPFKKGAFHIALAAQCPIQPVVCSQYHFLDSSEHRFDSGHSIIEFLPAIPTKGMKMEQLEEVMNKSRDVMQKAFTRVSKEAARSNKNK